MPFSSFSALAAYECTSVKSKVFKSVSFDGSAVATAELLTGGEVEIDLTGGDVASGHLDGSVDLESYDEGETKKYVEQFFQGLSDLAKSHGKDISAAQIRGLFTDDSGDLKSVTIAADRLSKGKWSISAPVLRAAIKAMTGIELEQSVFTCK